MRQTDYTEEIAREKLVEFENDPIKVIQDYMGINKKKSNQPSSIKSLNQEIYKQLRTQLDDSMRTYNKKQQEKLTEEIRNNNNVV